FILPYLEYDDLFEQLGVEDHKLTALFANPANEVLLQTRLPVFCCPSDNTPDLMPWNLRAFAGTGNTGHWILAKANYAACQGLYTIGGEDTGAAEANNGVFFNNSAITPAMI